MQYCSLQYWTLLLITSHIHNCVLFFLWLHPFILSGVISPLISSSILGTYWPWGVPLSVSYHYVFSYCSWGSQGKNSKVVCHSLLQWTTFCQSSLPWPDRLGLPHMAWLSFIVLDKAVVCVIRLANFLWLWFQCVCPPMPSCNTYHLTWVSLTLDMGSSSQLLLALDEVTPPDLEHGVAPLCPPAPTQPLLLGRGVVPVSRRPWPQTWDSSSRLLLRHHSPALLVAASDLGCGVAPLGRAFPSQQLHFCLVGCSRHVCNRQYNLTSILFL